MRGAVRNLNSGQPRWARCVVVVEPWRANLGERGDVAGGASQSDGGRQSLGPEGCSLRDRLRGRGGVARADRVSHGHGERGGALLLLLRRARGRLLLEQAAPCARESRQGRDDGVIEVPLGVVGGGGWTKRAAMRCAEREAARAARACCCSARASRAGEGVIHRTLRRSASARRARQQESGARERQKQQRRHPAAARGAHR